MKLVDELEEMYFQLKESTGVEVVSKQSIPLSKEADAEMFDLVFNMPDTALCIFAAYVQEEMQSRELEIERILE